MLECREKSVSSSTQLKPRRSEGRGWRVVGFSGSRSVEASELFPHPFSSLQDRSRKEPFLYFAIIWWDDGNSTRKLLSIMFLARLQFGK